MRFIFAGTPDFAAVHLQALLDSGLVPVCVYTQPDRPAGRGHKLTPSPVKTLACAHHVPVRTPSNFKNEEDLAAFEQLEADLCIVVAYGLILPERILKAPRLGCINVHGSLLPKYRGAAPIQRALMDGEKETGVSIMQLSRELDAGAVYTTAALPIKADDTTGTLFDKLAALGAQTLLEILPELEAQRLDAIAQDDTKASYAGKIGKAEAELDFSKPASVLDRTVRALNPWPIATATLDGVRYKVFRTEVSTTGPHTDYGRISSVSKAGIEINCATDSLILKIIQSPGKSQVNAGDFARSCPDRFSIGKYFDSIKTRA